VVSPLFVIYAVLFAAARCLRTAALVFL